jgi:heme/copper-type cytochrome/quinol oxidase subunit 3
MLETLNAFGVPFLNTVLLLTSGASITVTHESIIGGFKNQASEALLETLALAIIFTGLQYLEYITSAFTISDSVYGSTFFLATGFHGFHVIIGTFFNATSF